MDRSTVFIEVAGQCLSFDLFQLLSETPNSELINERIKLNRTAHQNPSTINPGTISAAISTITALITNKNRPMVNIVMGIVRKISIGLIVRFNKANKAAITIPVKKSATEIPGKINAVIITATPATTICAIIPNASLVLLITAGLMFSKNKIYKLRYKKFLELDKILVHTSRMNYPESLLFQPNQEDWSMRC